MEWLLIIYFNGWIHVPEKFRTEQQCLVASRIFNESMRKTRDGAVSWCTQRVVA